MPPKKNAGAKGPKTSSKGDDEGKGKEKKGGSAVKVSKQVLYGQYLSFMVYVHLCRKCHATNGDMLSGGFQVPRAWLLF